MAARARPLAESTPSSERRSTGTPIRVRGIGTSRPRFQRLGLDGGRVHQVVAEPDLAGQADRFGPPVEHRLGADVDHDAADLRGAQAAADPR